MTGLSSSEFVFSPEEVQGALQGQEFVVQPLAGMRATVNSVSAVG